MSEIRQAVREIWQVVRKAWRRWKVRRRHGDWVCAHGCQFTGTIAAHQRQAHRQR